MQRQAGLGLAKATILYTIQASSGRGMPSRRELLRGQIEHLELMLANTISTRSPDIVPTDALIAKAMMGEQKEIWGR